MFGILVLMALASTWGYSPNSQVAPREEPNGTLTHLAHERDSTMKYTRLYTDENGESHIEDIVVKFQSIDFAPPAPPVEISEFTTASRYAILKVPAGLFGDWHSAPSRQTHFYLSGEIEAEVSDGEIRRFGPGSVVLVEDTEGKGHTSRAVGTSDVLIAIVQ
jgi:quercetin dioxygenase-like cupin family protein